MLDCFPRALNNATVLYVEGCSQQLPDLVIQPSLLTSQFLYFHVFPCQAKFPCFSLDFLSLPRGNLSSSTLGLAFAVDNSVSAGRCRSRIIRDMDVTKICSEKGPSVKQNKLLEVLDCFPRALNNATVLYVDGCYQQLPDLDLQPSLLPSRLL